MMDYKKNSVIRVRSDSEFQEFHQNKSNIIMDEIDLILAKHYQFNAEELNFIINFEINYRMGIGASVVGDDEEGDGNEE
jgi:hypothetical protein